jgi:hypothetical protein
MERRVRAAMSTAYQFVRRSLRARFPGTRRSATAWVLTSLMLLNLWQVVELQAAIILFSVLIGLILLATFDWVMERSWPGISGKALLRATIVSLILNIGFDECPHATYVSFGPMIFTVSGKRCGNPRAPGALINRLTGIPNPWTS